MAASFSSKLLLPDVPFLRLIQLDGDGRAGSGHFEGLPVDADAEVLLSSRFDGSADEAVHPRPQTFVKNCQVEWSQVPT